MIENRMMTGNRVDCLYRVSADKQGKFDILLVFMFDRFWQADGESEKTSIRTKTALGQLVEDGGFKGGLAPYGYDLVKSGRFNKRKHEVFELAVNEAEAAVVRIIFDKYVHEGFGAQRIATYLNNLGYRARTGKMWHHAAVRSVSEIKQLLWRDLQHLAELEDHVEGNAYVSQLNGADMTAVDVHQLGQLELGELFPLPIKNHVQTEFFIELLVFFPHFRHLCQYLRGVFCEYKPCKTSVTLLTQVVSLATMSVLYRKGDIFMKKAICFLLALAMMLSLCACGAPAANADANGENTAQQQEQAGSADETPDEPAEEETPAESDRWHIDHYVDNFQQPTDESYIANMTPFVGTFSNSATRDSLLYVKVVADAKDAAFFLYEYGRDNPVKNSSSNYTDPYNITMRLADGTETAMTGTMYCGGDRVYVDDAYYDAVIAALNQEDTTVAFYIEDAERTVSHYLFTIETSNFPELYQELV